MNAFDLTDCPDISAMLSILSANEEWKLDEKCSARNLGVALNG